MLLRTAHTEGQDVCISELVFRVHESTYATARQSLHTVNQDSQCSIFLHHGSTEGLTQTETVVPQSQVAHNIISEILFCLKI